MKHLIPALVLLAALPLQAAEPGAGTPAAVATQPPTTEAVGNLAGHPWMLNAISVRPPDHPNAASLKQHAERVHPPGKMFFEFTTDGQYTMVRGGESRQTGTWSLVADNLTLTRSKEAGAPLVFGISNLSKDRLTLKLPLPSGAPDVLLDFAPGSMPQ